MRLRSSLPRRASPTSTIMVIALTSLHLLDCNNMEDCCTKFKMLQHQLAAMRSELQIECYNTLFIGGLITKFAI
jgi:hypothetical protein